MPGRNRLIYIDLREIFPVLIRLFDQVVVRFCAIICTKEQGKSFRLFRKGFLVRMRKGSSEHQRSEKRWPDKAVNGKTISSRGQAAYGSLRSLFPELSAGG